MFIHLRAHSAYSLQEGLLSPEELAHAAHEHGMPALGLTDHNLLTGAAELVAACGAAEIQPLLGLEIAPPSGSLSLLAMSLAGCSNLSRLSSALALLGEFQAACSFELLNEYSSHLIAMTNGHALDELNNIFADRLYVELQNPAPAGTMLHGARRSDLARKLDLTTVVT